MYTATFLNHSIYIWQLFFKKNDILRYVCSSIHSSRFNGYFLTVIFNGYFLQCTGGLFSSVGAFLPELTFSPLLVLSSFSLGLAWINRWSKKPIMDDTRLIRLDHESPPPPTTPLHLSTSSHPRRTIEHFWILNWGPKTQRRLTQVAGRWGLIKWKKVCLRKKFIVPARRAQQTNQGICTPRVSICLSFNSQQRPPPNGLSVFRLSVKAIDKIWRYMLTDPPCCLYS
jgi:hypothetical protein